MNIGLGLYRHMLTRENYRFARQRGCSYLVIHLVDYNRQQAAATGTAGDNQPVGTTSGGWGIAGDPGAPWTTEELLAIRREIEHERLLIPDHTPLPDCGAPWHAGMAYTLGYLRAALTAID